MHFGRLSEATSIFSIKSYFLTERPKLFIKTKSLSKRNVIIAHLPGPNAKVYPQTSHWIKLSLKLCYEIKAMRNPIRKSDSSSWLLLLW